MFEFLTTLSWAAVFQIILIDIMLGGDNAVVIALACRNLPPKQRWQGIVWGTAGAIVLRVILIVFALKLLEVPFLKVIGALLLLWIGIKLMLPENDEHTEMAGGASLLAAIKTILIADFIMSLDNVIAIAAAAQGAASNHQLGLVIFGLLVSVPIIVWGSALVLKVLDRYPLLIVFSAALLGWIAGDMFIGDIVFVRYFGEPDFALTLAAQVFGVVCVVGVGKYRMRHLSRSGS